MDLKGYIEKNISKVAWSAKRTHGSCFAIHFGRRHSVLRRVQGVYREIEHGDFSILVLSDNWLGECKTEKCESHFSEKAIDQFLKRTEGGMLLNVVFNESSVELLFADCRINVFTHADDSDLMYFSSLMPSGKAHAMWGINSQLQIRRVGASE